MLGNQGVQNGADTGTADSSNFFAKVTSITASGASAGCTLLPLACCVEHVGDALPEAWLHKDMSSPCREHINEIEPGAFRDIERTHTLRLARCGAPA